jgi:prevent-host-death family protein
MKSVSASEFKATCLELVDRVFETGEPVLITKHGKAVAQLVRPPDSERSGKWLGCGVGTGRILGDITAPVADLEDWQAPRK